MTKESIQQLSEELGPFLLRQETNMRKPVDVITQVCHITDSILNDNVI